MTGIAVERSESLNAALYSPTASLPLINCSITVSILQNIATDSAIAPIGHPSLMMTLKRSVSNPSSGIGEKNFHRQTMI